MLEFDISLELRKNLRRLEKKNPVLSEIFRRKLEEVISHDIYSIDTYKNLRAPLNKYKRIHLTRNKILIFQVMKEKKLVKFSNIIHRKEAYR